MTAVCSGMSPTVTPLPRQNSRGPSSHRRRTVRRAVLELTSMIAARSLRGHSLSERSFSISDAATYLRGHLFVESHRVGTVNLDMLNDAIAHSTMSLQAPIRPAEPVDGQPARPINVARRI